MNANDFGTVENMGMEMEWDAEISKESDFVLLPAGEYDFKVAVVEEDAKPRIVMKNNQFKRHTNADLVRCLKIIRTIEFK